MNLLGLMMSNILANNNSNTNMPNTGNTSTVDVDNIIKRLLDGKLRLTKAKCNLYIF